MSDAPRRRAAAGLLRWWPVGVLAVCIVVPLAVDPWGLRPFLPVKQAVLVAAVAATALAAALARFTTTGAAAGIARGRAGDADHTLILLTAALWVWSVGAPAVTAASGRLHLLGAAYLTTLVGLAALTAGAVVSDRRWGGRVAGAIATVSLLMLAHVLLQAVGLDPLAWVYGAAPAVAGRWRAFATTGNPNWTGAFLAATAPLVAYTIAARPRVDRFARPLLAVLYGVALVATGSRLALIAFVAGVAVWYGARRRMVGRRAASSRRLPAATALTALFVLAVAAAAALYLGQYIPQRWQDVDSLYGRLFQFGAAWKLIEISPVTGHGLDHFELLLPEGMRQLLPQLPPAWQQHAPAELAAHVHNDFLETAVESGVVGLALLGTLWVLATSRALGRCRRPSTGTSCAEVVPRVSGPHPRHAGTGLDPALAACLATLAVLSLGTVPLQTPATAVLFWVTLGLVIGGNRASAPPTAGEEGGRRRVAAALWLTATALLAAVAFVHAANLLIANRSAAQARDLLAAQAYESAEQIYRGVVQRCPWDHQSGMLLAALLVARERPDDALEVLDQAERWSSSREAWLVRAEALKTSGRPAQAVDILEGAVAAVPDFLRGHAALANLHLMLGEREAALEAYQRIVASNQSSELADALKENARENLADVNR